MPYRVLAVAQCTKDGALIDGVADEVVLRIRKMLDRAEHPDTPTPEAEHAMARAKRELTRFSLTRATVLGATDALVGKAEHGAMWQVAVGSDTHKRVAVYGWLDALLATIANGFDVAYYTATGRESTTFTFYGLERSAEVAARAFKAYFARVEAMAHAYTPDAASALAALEREFAQRVAANELGFGAATAEFARRRTELLRVFARQARDAYRFGLARGLRALFVAEADAEQRRVDELEARAEKARRARAQRDEAAAAAARWRQEEAAHLMNELAAGRVGEAIAPLLVDVDADDDDDAFDLEAAEREVAVALNRTKYFGAKKNLCRPTTLFGYFLVLLVRTNGMQTTAWESLSLLVSNVVAHRTRQRCKSWHHTHLLRSHVLPVKALKLVAPHAARRLQIHDQNTHRD